MRAFVISIVLLCLSTISVPSQTQTPTGETPSPILNLTGVTFPVHDPMLVKDGEMYYVYGTGAGITIHCSKDMLNWDNCGKAFRIYPYWIYKINEGITDLWAPDLSFWNGKWHLYYAASSFGSNRSAIGLATNVTLDQDSKQYKWVDEGEVISTQKTDNFNAIDPNLITDQDGQRWLAMGSFWTGIKMRKLDNTTGKLDASDTTTYALASRPGSTAIEAPYITYRKGYYYLFVSFDACCKGVDSTYKMMVGRSEKITGPYVDKDNKPMLDGGGSLLYAGSERWRGPGHNSIYVEKDVYWLAYHSYDATINGAPVLRIEALGWDDAGWPIAPSALATDK